MNKKTILLITLGFALAGFLVIKEYIDNSKKGREAAPITVADMEPLTLTDPKPDEDGQKLIIRSSGAVTFLLTAKDIIYYYKGAFNGLLNKTDYNKVRDIIKKYNTVIDPKELMFIIKTDNTSTFKNTIDMLDEMTINKIPAGHYAETEITEEEINSIKKYNDN